MPYIHFGNWRLHYYRGPPWLCLRVAVVGSLWTSFVLYVLRDIYMRRVSIHEVVWRLFMGSLLWEVVSRLIPQRLLNPRPTPANLLPVTMARPTGV